MAIKFMKSKKLEEEKKTFNQNDGADQGTYSKKYLENSLAELLALQKTIDKDIRVIKQKLALKEQGREVRYTKYDLSKDV